VTLLDMSPAEMKQAFKDAGIPAFRADQVYGWLMKGADFDGMTNVPAAVRQQIQEKFAIGGCSVELKQVSRLDGTAKYLFLFSDLNMVEGVLMHHDYGNTLCISTQVGCRMGCAFCASTLEGRVRNLTAGEMLAEVLTVNRDMGGDRAVDHVVLMGSGEPLDNYDEVLRFLRRIHDPKGLNISMRNISLSTCGLVPEMRRLADENLGVTLAVSLHAPNDGVRRQLMPVAKSYPMEDVLDAARYYVTQTGRRVVFEYALVDSLNDEPEHARELASRLRGLQCHVNVIALNPVAEAGLKGSGPARIRAFMDELTRLNISVTRRVSMGADLDGACGQLRRRALGKGGDHAD